MDQSHTFATIRSLVHNGLLIIGSGFLFASLLLISKSPLLPPDQALFLYQFLIMPTFFLFLVDVGLTIARQVLYSGQQNQTHTISTILTWIIGCALFLTLLFYVL